MRRAACDSLAWSLTCFYNQITKDNSISKGKLQPLRCRPLSTVQELPETPTPPPETPPARPPPPLLFPTPSKTFKDDLKDIPEIPKGQKISEGNFGVFNFPKYIRFFLMISVLALKEK